MLLKILRYFFADREKKRKKAKCPNIKSITSKHLVANSTWESAHLLSKRINI